jgi:Putative Flp pilus-assembly TadE/G-like/SdrD B-like domain
MPNQRSQKQSNPGLRGRVVTRRARHGQERGVTAVLTAISATFLVGMMAFAVDIGNAMQVQRKAQNAADSASFAGLQRYQDVKKTGTSENLAMAEAIMEAQIYAEKNFPGIKWADCAAVAPDGFQELNQLKQKIDLTAEETISMPDGVGSTPCIVIGRPNIPGVLTSDPLQMKITIPSVTQAAFGTVFGSSVINTKSNAAYETKFVDGVPNGSIAGCVCVQDSEVGIAGAVVTLTSSDPNFAPRTHEPTLGDGLWKFDLLPKGTYSIEETQPSFDTLRLWNDGTEVPGTGASSAGNTTTNDKFSDIKLKNGQQADKYKFYETTPGVSIRGRVIDQSNPGNPGIPGVTITLSGNVPILTPTAVTDIDGNYEFIGLSAGTYAIAETQPTLSNTSTRLYAQGDAATTFAINGKTAAEITAVGTYATDVFSNVVLTDNQSATDYDFLEKLPLGSIAGRVIAQRASGVEVGNGIAEVVMTLSNSAGAFKTAKTTATGAFTFADVPAGTYAITQTQNADYVDGPETPGTVDGKPQGTPGALGTDSISNIQFGSGDTGVGYIFAESLTPGSISGKVWNSTASTGMPGYEIYLDGVAKTQSDASGNWSIPNLEAETEYTISRNIFPSAFNEGPSLVGNAGKKPGTVTAPGVFSEVSLLSKAGGDHAINYIFQATESPASISGTVFVDGAPRVGIPLTLDSLNGPQATSDSNGRFTFNSVATGSRLVFMNASPTAYPTVTASVGTLTGSTALNGSIAANARSITNIAIAPGNQAINYNFMLGTPVVTSTTTTSTTTTTTTSTTTTTTIAPTTTTTTRTSTTLAPTSTTAAPTSTTSTTAAPTTTTTLVPGTPVTLPPSITPACSTGNLILNGSFESGSSGTLSNWTTSGNAQTYSPSLSNKVGTFIAYVGGGSAGYIRQSIAATPGYIYETTYYGGTHNPNSNAKIEVAYLNASGAIVGTATTYDMDTSIDVAPQKMGGPYRFTTTAPTGATQLRVHAYVATPFQSGSNAYDYVKIDGVSVVRCTVATTTTTTAAPTTTRPATTTTAAPTTTRPTTTTTAAPTTTRPTTTLAPVVTTVAPTTTRPATTTTAAPVPTVPPTTTAAPTTTVAPGVPNTLPPSITPACSTGNLITNGSFEIGSSGSFSGWTTTGNAGTYTPNLLNKTGTYIAYVGGGSAGYIRQSIAATPGWQYETTYWGGTHISNSNAKIEVAYLNNSGTVLSAITYDMDTSIDVAPQKMGGAYRFKTTAPAGATQLRVNAYVSTPFQTGSNAYDYVKIDGVSIVKC